ncbi:MAG: hypothetical protein ACYC9X_10485 [Dehalococcoidia bacterium]
MIRRFAGKYRRVAAALALSVVVGGVAALVVVVGRSQFVSSQAPNPVVDFTKLTPLPFYGYGTVTPPNFDPTALAHCQLPANDRPAPGLPPLSCRSTGAEPPPGAIPTPAPGQRPSLAKVAAPAGWQTFDNPLFRFTYAIPPGWYSNMRPEGGTFQVDDPPAVIEANDGKANPPGGVAVFFSAIAYVPPTTPKIASPADKVLAAPNAMFGTVPGGVWDEGPGEGLAHIIHGVFVRDGILYQIRAHIEGDGRTSDQIAIDLATVRELFARVNPY